MADFNPYTSDLLNEGFLAYLYLVGNQTNPPLVHSISYGDVEATVFNASVPGSSAYAQRYARAVRASTESRCSGYARR